MAEEIQVSVNDTQEQVSIYVDSGSVGVESVTGDGVGGTPTNVVMTFPTPAEIGAALESLEYNTIALMLSDQANQNVAQEIVVINAIADTNIIFPIGETRLWAYYQYLGVANGVIGDYRLISAPYGIQKILQSIKTGNFTLAPADNDNTISMDGGICTINPDTQAYQDAFIVAMKNITDATAGSIVCTALAGWTYKINNTASVASGTFAFAHGSTCTIIKFTGTNIIYIDGGVE